MQNADVVPGDGLQKCMYAAQYCLLSINLELV